MSKVEYLGITFDSQLEADYYGYLLDLKEKKEVVKIKYHPSQIKELIGKRSYTPDFIVEYLDRIEVVETKGYNPYSVRIDEQIHNAMLQKDSEWLKDYCLSNNFDLAQLLPCIYTKIKHLKAFGFVDFNFKNPNTLVNQKRAKIKGLEAELKELSQFKKDTIRFFRLRKTGEIKKLTKKQIEFYLAYQSNIAKEIAKSKKEKGDK